MVGKRGLLMAGLVGALVLVVETATSASASTLYQVAPIVQLNVRRGPGTSYQIVKVLPYDANVTIYCQSPGTKVSGYYGTSTIWDNIGPDQFISDAYVNTGSDGYITGRCA
jgi:uncharacterized protein YraI